MEFLHGFRVGRELWAIGKVGHQNMLKNLKSETRVVFQRLVAKINGKSYDSFFNNWVLYNLVDLLKTEEWAPSPYFKILLH